MGEFLDFSAKFYQNSYDAEVFGYDADSYDADSYDARFDNLSYDAEIFFYHSLNFYSYDAEVCDSS